MIDPEEEIIVRRKLIDALESGRVGLPPGTEESLVTIGRVRENEPRFAEITDVKLRCWGKGGPSEGGFEMEWQAYGVGFGSVTIRIKQDGTVNCDSKRPHG